MITLFDDYEFIINSMREYDHTVYTDDDFELFMVLPKECYCIREDNTVIAFGCLVFVDDIPYMTYTWNNGTLKAKKAYINGFNQLLDIHPNMVFGANASRFNKVKRRINA